MARASTKSGLLKQSKNFPTKQRAKPKLFCMLSVTPWVHLLINLERTVRRFTMCPSIMLLVIEIGSPRASNKFSLSRITRNCYGFLASIITQDSWKFYNGGTKFSSLKLEYMVFSIPELHDNTEEIPLDLDIPQSLNSL